MTRSGHWLCIAAMVSEPLRCRRFSFGGDMRRREFITLLGGVAAAWPLETQAQQPAMPVIGWLETAGSGVNPHLEAAFRQGLNDVGFVDGQNLTIEARWGDGRYDRLPELASDLVSRHVSLIAATGSVP